MLFEFKIYCKIKYILYHVLALLNITKKTLFYCFHFISIKDKKINFIINTNAPSLDSSEKQIEVKT